MQEERRNLILGVVGGAVCLAVLIVLFLLLLPSGLVERLSAVVITLAYVTLAWLYIRQQRLLENQQRIMELQHEPRIRVVDRDWRYDESAPIFSLFLRNTGDGIAQNLRVIGIIAVQDGDEFHAIETMSKDGRQIESPLISGGAVRLATSDEAFGVANQLRFGGFLEPNEGRQGFEARLIFQGRWAEDGELASSSEVFSALRKSNIDEVGAFLYLRYKDRMEKKHFEYIGCNRELDINSFELLNAGKKEEADTGLIRGLQTEPPEIREYSENRYGG